MVIELSGVQFGLKSTRDLKSSMIADQNCTKFNCPFITFILESHNLIA